jgi:hypothetical protein
VKRAGIFFKWFIIPFLKTLNEEKGFEVVEGGGIGFES